MSDALAKYSFLPWFRQGLARHISQLDVLNKSGDAAFSDRASFPIRLRIIGDGDPLDPVEKSFQLIGPGDIVGINPQAIIKTEPKDGFLKFEPNFLPYLEFYAEDFPWRYSPAGPSGSKLRPWIALIVLESSEFERISLGKLPGIKLLEGAENGPFPPASQIYYWAHVQVNRNLKDKAESEDLPRDIGRLQNDLNSNPNIASSRVISPRKLKAETQYFAFLIPAFEQGRRAGLGLSDQEIYTVNNQMASWGLAHELLPDQFPVYFEFSFQTGQGDFEQLIQQLQARVPHPNLGRKPMSIHNPDYYLAHQKIYQWEGAIRQIQYARPFFKELNYQLQLKEYLNQSESLQSQASGDDPMILPPIYGTAYRPGETVDPKKKDWLNELNLDPRNRGAAALGTKVVQSNQEEYMNQAWEQVDELLEKNKKIQQAILAEQAGKKLFEKYLKVLPDSSLMALTSPLQSKIKSGTKTLKSTVKNSAFPTALMNANFRKTTVKASKSPMLKGELQTSAVSQSVLNQSFQRDYEIKPLLIPLSFNISTGLARAVSLVNVQQAFSGFTKKKRLSNRSKLKKSKSNIEIWGGKETIGLRDFQKGVRSLSGHISPANFTGFEPGPNLDIPSLSLELKTLLDPLVTVRKKIWSTVPAISNAAELNTIMAYPEFEQPMYEPLKDLSLDYLIPNAHLIPEDSVLLLENNSKFIESYLMGLNHEMGRELLWREYPTDKRGSYFRQFWNTGDAKDPQPTVKKLDRWGKQRLGANRPFGVPAAMLVFVLRSALVHRYPGFICYLSPAKRRGSKREFVTSEKNIILPEFRADITRDISLLGFAVQLDPLIAHPGYYFVLKERPGEIRFGLDVSPQGPTSFGKVKNSDELAWTHLEGNKQYAKLNTQQYIQAKQNRKIGAYRWGKDAAHMAGLLYQNPVMAAIHCSQFFGE